VAFRGTLAAAGGAALLAPLWWGPVSQGLFRLEFAVAGLLPQGAIAGAAWFLLPLVGLGAGLLASLSPCVLPLVPLNVAYIGAADASGGRAVALSARFVLGAALALSVLGLAGDLTGFLLVEQRGPVLIVVGLALVYFGLAALEVAPVPFAGRAMGGERRLGPVAAGAAFSLVTTPCASPLLAAVLAAAGSQGVPGLGVVSMLGFALGYTLLVFLAGAFGGEMVARLRRASFEAPRAAAAALLLTAGTGFALVGVLWFR
jgi:cytochrome c-type biogenesis protein